MKKSLLGIIGAWCVLLYFVILFAERAQSIVRVLANGLFAASGFDIYVNLVTILSLAATVFLLALRCGSFWQALAGKGEADWKGLTLTIAALLCGGMVHTEYTAAVVQFIAYGALIVAMILRTAEVTKNAENKWKYWFSLVYLTAFSMAIPVNYRSHIEASVLFHILEAVTAGVLVFFFSLMLLRLFEGKGEDLLLPLPALLMVVLDAAVIILRAGEELNTFVLIFAVLSALLFIAGRISFALGANKKGS